MWKPVAGYEGVYKVSDCGEVKSLDRVTFDGRKLKGKPRIAEVAKNGYSRMLLWSGDKSNKCLVHRLVAQAFIPNPDSKPQVNHIDGNKLNNHADNLEWATGSENQAHAVRTGLRSIQVGEQASQAKLTQLEALDVLTRIANGARDIDVVRATGFNRATINDIRHRRTWKHLSVIGRI